MGLGWEGGVEEGGAGIVRQNPNKQDKPLFLVSQLVTLLVTGQCVFLQICAAGGRNNGGLQEASSSPPSKNAKESVLLKNVNQALLFVSRSPDRVAGSVSDFVVNVGGALRRHLLDNVDGVAVVAAHLLVMRAVVVLCPQRNDDVTWLRASRAARQLGVGQGAQRQRGGAGLRVAVFSRALAHLDEEDDEEEDEKEEDDAAGPDGGEHGHFGAEDAVRIV